MSPANRALSPPALRPNSTQPRDPRYNPNPLPPVIPSSSSSSRTPAAESSSQRPSRSLGHDSALSLSDKGPAASASEQPLTPPEPVDFRPPAPENPFFSSDAGGADFIEVDSDENGSDADSAFGGSLIGCDTDTLASYITDYRYENGRRYHAYQDGEYWVCGGSLLFISGICLHFVQESVENIWWPHEAEAAP